MNKIFNKKAEEGKQSSLLKEQNITGIVVSRQIAANQTLRRATTQSRNRNDGVKSDG